MSSIRYAQLSDDQLQAIDGVCAEFERSLAGDETTRIEDYLSKLPSECRVVLLRELLATELEWRVAQGEQPAPDDYESRFSELQQEIAAVFVEALAESEAPTALVSRDAAANQTATDMETVAQDAAGLAGMPNPFGRYRVERLLGRGGMGTVYLAYDQQLQRQVALKLPSLDTEDRRIIERFSREALAMASVSHPHICPIHDVGEYDGHQYLTMTYLDGRTLAEVLKEDPLPSATEAAKIVRTLASSIHVAHESGVVHRDLKPSNVMMTPQVGPVLMDFGLARSTVSDPGEITTTSGIVGSPAYMAPEQIGGTPSEVGPAADVYALGVILYELLSGARPFHGESALILAQVLAAPPPRPSNIRHDIPPKLEAICLRALNKRPDDRYPSAQAFAETLDEYLKSVDAPPPPVTRNPPNPWMAIPAGIALLALIVVWVIFSRQEKLGTIQINLPADLEASVEIRKAGDLVKTLNSANRWQADLPFGRYTLNLHTDERFQFVLDQSSIRVAGDEPLIVNIVPKPPPERLLTVDEKTRLPLMSKRLSLYPQKRSTGIFEDSGQRLEFSAPQSIALGDLDGDEDLDVFVCNCGAANEIWFNDGKGFFENSGQELTNDSGVDVKLADLDADGDLDAYVVVAFTGDQVWFNNGKGEFRDGGQRLSRSNGLEVVLGDLDGDGDVDAHVVKFGPSYSWLNDGNGFFTRKTSVGNLISFSAALGDLDADGDLDIMQGNTNGIPDRVWLNEGDATFESTGQELGGNGSAMQVRLADNDNDGDLDAFITGSGAPCIVYSNDGNGRFEQTDKTPVVGRYVNTLLGDFNGDSHIDLVLFSHNDTGKEHVSVWLHQTEANQSQFGTAQTIGSEYATGAAGDLDGDGDLDLVIASGSETSVWFNRDLDEERK